MCELPEKREWGYALEVVIPCVNGGNTDIVEAFRWGGEWRGSPGEKGKRGK